MSASSSDLSVETYKLVVVGPGGVGKSATIIQLVQNVFLEEYDPTIEDSYRAQLEVDGAPVILDILDTAGQEGYSAMRDAYYTEGDTFVVIYSVTKRTSLTDTRKFIEHIGRVKDCPPESLPIVLIGNKRDLKDSRQVSEMDGKAVAERWKCPFFEISAKTRVNVNAAFQEAVRLARTYKREKSALQSGSLHGGRRGLCQIF